MKTYQLFIHLEKDILIQIGKLGKFNFPAGDYVYTGSAKKNIEARIKRHLSKNKKLRWHIDYLLNNPATKITETKMYTEKECTLNQKTKGTIIAPHFGASDCKQGCVSHLKYRS